MQSHLHQFKSWYLSGFVSLCVTGISIHLSCVILFKCVAYKLLALQWWGWKFKGSRHYSFLNPVLVFHWSTASVHLTVILYNLSFFLHSMEPASFKPCSHIFKMWPNWQDSMNSLSNWCTYKPTNSLMWFSRRSRYSCQHVVLKSTDQLPMQYNIIIAVCVYKWWTVCWEQYLDIKGRKWSLWEIKPTSVYTDM